VDRRRQLLAIAFGGAVGTVVRIGLYELLPVGSDLPWATLAVNVAGAFALGALAAATLGDDPLSGWRMPLLGTGLCGALTTFSGLCWEMLDLIDRGRAGTALAYVSLSLVLGVAAAVAGGRLASARDPAGERAA